MRIQFLGTNCNLETRTIAVPITKFTGKFRGQTYTIRRRLVSRNTTKRNLVYRGVAY